jgi:putative (di)nucleoside polyphosphate hydrolase
LDSIDSEGFRANVGIVICNASNAVLVGGRVGQEGWQFPQGGIREGETPEQAMYRELHEEVGLQPGDVQLLASTADWLRYRLPEQYVRRHLRPLCIGQKQRWYLLRLLTDDSHLRLDAGEVPEFDRWRWTDYWEPVRSVIFFKRTVYINALRQLGPQLYPAGLPAYPDWWQTAWDSAA